MNSFSKIITIAAFLLLSLTSGQVIGKDQPDLLESLQKIDFLLDQGLNHRAWQLLQQRQSSAHGFEVLWRKARVQYEMGRIADETDKDNALSCFEKAEEYARLAIAAAPERSDGYKWLAIALGAQLKDSDVKTQVQLSRDVKENIERAITLNPDDDIAYLVLSRWHYKVSALSIFAKAYAKLVYEGIPKASLDLSKQLLWTAIKLKDRIAHRYNLAKVYDRMGQRKEAIEQLKQALLLPVTFPEEAKELVKAQEKLQNWQ
jgi:tetratricopeptide (TPR) repeat protein